ncbi:MAG: hypothetical protein ACKVP1_15560 [Burkholderiaceae bacterium]
MNAALFDDRWFFSQSLRTFLCKSQQIDILLAYLSIPLQPERRDSGDVSNIPVIVARDSGGKANPRATTTWTG